MHLADRRINLFSYGCSNRRQLERIRWEIHFFPKVLLNQTKIETNLSYRNFGAGAHHLRFHLISKRHSAILVTKIIQTAYMHGRRSPQIERNKREMKRSQHAKWISHCAVLAITLTCKRQFEWYAATALTEHAPHSNSCAFQFYWTFS